MTTASRRFLRAAAVLALLAVRAAAAENPEPGPALTARLERAASLDGPLDRPARLARLCLDARLACGFELREDVWRRPESKRRVPSATVGQALTMFMGKDYRFEWRDGVLLMAPAAPGPAALDAEVAADVSGESPSDPGETLRAVARKTGLRLSASGKPPRRPRAGTGVALPMTAPARRVLGLWARPALARPNAWVAVYSRDGRSGRLYWYWGGGRAGGSSLNTP